MQDIFRNRMQFAWETFLMFLVLFIVACAIVGCYAITVAVYDVIEVLSVDCTYDEQARRQYWKQRVAGELEQAKQQ